MKNILKVVLLLALAIQLGAGAIQLTQAQEDEALCTRNSSDGCDNNGCEGTGGVCGRALESIWFDESAEAESPCWCLY